MILAALEIRDYKQFAGDYLLELESQGIVGVVGPNGAGKTTLFEAIEWCLYGPRSIASNDVFPRGRVGKPLVRVTLQHPETGERYVIERQIRGKTMRAEVWREDRADEILATGSAPVRAYVTEKLIGLSHDAFVSTFFTRQKELSFFGSLRPTERRVMVGRLIGVEAVRLAQESIGLERSQALQRAEGLAAQVEHEQQGRDLTAEITAAATRMTEATALVEQRAAEQALVRDALERTERAAEIVRQREQRDRELSDALTVPVRQQRVLEAEITRIETELNRLERERARRDGLLRLAEAQPERSQAVTRWVGERERHLQAIELRKRQDLHAHEHRATLTAVAHLISESAHDSLPDWRWSGETAAIPGLLAFAESLDAIAAQRVAQQLERIALRQRDLQEARTQLGRFEQRLKELLGQERQLLNAGEPAAAIERLQDRIAELRSDIHRAEADAAQAEKHANDLRPLIEHLGNHALGGLCPTCGREIAAGESEGVLATLRAQEQTWLEQRNHRRDEIARLTARDKSEQTALIAEQERASALTQLRSRQESGQQMTADKRAEIERVATEVGAMLAQLRRELPPTEEELAAAQQRATLLATIAQAAIALRQRHAQLLTIEATAIHLTGELEALGVVSYDEAGHRAAVAVLDESNSAVATLAQIERDLARQPQLQAELAAKTAELAEARTAADAITTARTEHAYTPDEATAAREATIAATRQERITTSALHDAQTALRDRSSEATALTREQARIAELANRAIAIRRDADELDRMYREFAAFDQFVAARIAPRLAEQTSELLSFATDGKYDRVEFDENYGISVFDGDEECFALDGFSGGERDVVALCARLALSQVIAAAAVNPPSFLVLDEVFGALDRERRAQLLDLLGQLSEQSSQFQQMFVISHVDDVRSSPVFSRVWRIVETDDGVSRIEDASANPASFEE
jgi:exonuclease SbcC